MATEYDLNNRMLLALEQVLRMLNQTSASDRQNIREVEDYIHRIKLAYRRDGGTKSDNFSTYLLAKHGGCNNGC